MSIARLYHDETKYTEENIRGTVPGGFAEQVPPFKDLHSQRSVDLGPYLPQLGGSPTSERPDYSQGSLLAKLSRTLYFTYGVTGVVQSLDSVFMLRAAPSAGGLYPVEVYVVSQDVPGLEDGVHDYSAREHRLVPVFDGSFREEVAAACFKHPAFERARVTLILTGVYGRSSWRYRERCYRRILLDSGHVIGNLALYAGQEELSAVPIAEFLDDQINQLFFLTSDQESVFAVVPLLDEGVDSSCWQQPSRRSRVVDPSATEDAPLFQAYHASSSLSFDEDAASDEGVRSEGAVPSRATKIPCRGSLDDLGDSLMTTMARRRSTRRFTGEPIGAESLMSILDFGYRSLTRERIPSTQGADLIDTYLIVQRVDGVEAGIYYYDVPDHALIPLKQGDFTDVVGHFCLGQELGSDSGAVVVHAADLDRAVEIHGDRAYRYLHMDAGTVGQYLNLAAVHLGVGVSGIGGFLDDEVNRLIGLPEDHVVLYLTALGDA